MSQKIAAQAEKKDAAPLVSGLLRHTAVRPLADHETPAMERPGPGFDHDFSHTAVRSTEPVVGQYYGTQACPVFPRTCPFGGACHTCPLPVQAKLKINQPGDKYEREADRVADLVMRMPDPRLQRQVEPAEEKEEEETIQTKQAGGRTPWHVPGLAAQVRSLKGGGRPLPRLVRNFFEPRFGCDFSQVRVHTDSQAVKSARAVDAQAFTLGHDVVFGAGQYAPRTLDGKRLLAHELTHVVQQERRGSFSNRTIFRRVARRLVNCTPGTHSAPADPVADLTNIEASAQALAQASANLLAIASTLTSLGMRDPTSAVDQAYQNRFGIPPARASGFLNRLTGSVRPTLDEAISEEMDLLSRRFSLIANTFNGFIHYRCIGGPSTFAGCSVDCVNADAVTCTGINVIFLCPGFWPSDDTNSTLLIHEAAHMIWGRVGHGARGPGGSFRHAECYASFVGDIFGITPGGPACPAP